MCLCMKSVRYPSTYLDCCLFLFILIILFLSTYILLHILNPFSAPCCNAFILCFVHEMCYTNKFDFDFKQNNKDVGNRILPSSVCISPQWNNSLLGSADFWGYFDLKPSVIEVMRMWEMNFGLFLFSLCLQRVDFQYHWLYQLHILQRKSGTVSVNIVSSS